MLQTKTLINTSGATKRPPYREALRPVAPWSVACECFFLLRKESQAEIGYTEEYSTDSAVTVKSPIIRLTLCVQKLIDADSSLAQNGPYGPLGHFLCMVRQCDSSAVIWVPPYFVAARTMSIKLKTERTQFPGNLPIIESRQTSHHRTPTGIVRSTG